MMCITEIESIEECPVHSSAADNEDGHLQWHFITRLWRVAILAVTISELIPIHPIYTV